MKSFFLTTIAILIYTFVLGQAPEKMSYQAVIRDANNELITNQAVGVQISIIQGSINSPAIYIETHTSTTNSNGLISLEIGSGTIISGVFSGINWASGTFYIKTETDPLGGTNYTITGTSQLLSVPYALHANSAGNVLWKQNSNNIYYNKGYVGIGAPGTFAELNVINDSSIIMFNQLTQIANFQRLYNNSSARFIIYGYPDTDIVLPHLRKSVMLYATDDASDMVLCATKPDGRIRFFTQAWDDPNSERMIIDESGDVGIGTNDPVSKLQITNGDVYLESIGSGVIMKSPNGQCWRMTVDNSGNPVFTSINCP